MECIKKSPPCANTTGIDIKCAQNLLGHSSIDITLEIYTHLDKNKLNDSIDVFDKYMKKISSVSQNIVKC